MKRFANPLLLGGLISFGLLLIVVLFAPTLAPHDPCKVSLERRLEGPGPQHPLGTDHLGRCVLSRVIWGARTSLGTSLVISVILFSCGLGIGLLAGLGGETTDRRIMSVVNLFLSFPTLILALTIAGFLEPSLKSTMLGVSTVAWAPYARLVRAMTLSAKEKEFVQAGRVVGTDGVRLLRYYIFPQLLPELLVLMSLETGWVMLVISGMSFLGLGAQPPSPEWGAMLNEARLLMQTSPHLMIAPGFAVFMSVLSFNLMGEGLKDAFQIRQSFRF